MCRLRWDRLENQRRIDLAQADVDTSTGGDGPGETPAVANWNIGEIRGRPGFRHIHSMALPDCIQIRAAMAIDHAFGLPVVPDV